MTFFPLRLFFKDKFIFFSLALALAQILFLTVYLRAAIPLTGGQVFLRSTVHFGIDYLGHYYQLFSLPLFGSFFLLFNFTLAYYFYGLNKKISFLLTGATVFLELVLLIQGFFLAFLNY